MSWTQQRKEQTWGEEEACRGNTEARMEKTNSARETKPGRKLLLHETHRQKPRWKRHLLRIYQNTKEVKPQVRRKLPWIPE